MQHCGQQASQASPQQLAQLVPQQFVVQLLQQSAAVAAAVAATPAEQHAMACVAPGALSARAVTLLFDKQQAEPPFAQQAAPAAQQSGASATVALARTPVLRTKATTATTASAPLQSQTNLVDMRISSVRMNERNKCQSVWCDA